APLCSIENRLDGEIDQPLTAGGGVYCQCRLMHFWLLAAANPAQTNRSATAASSPLMYTRGTISLSQGSRRYSCNSFFNGAEPPLPAGLQRSPPWRNRISSLSPTASRSPSPAHDSATRLNPPGRASGVT